MVDICCFSSKEHPDFSLETHPSLSPHDLVANESGVSQDPSACTGSGHVTQEELIIANSGILAGTNGVWFRFWWE